MRVPPTLPMARARAEVLDFVRSLRERFPEHGIESEIYVTAPGSEIEESHPLIAAIDAGHEQVFGAPPERDVVHWFSDASTLTRYGIESVNYGTSSGLPDPVLGENLDIEGLVRMAQGVRARRGAGVRGGGVKLVTFDDGKVGRVEDGQVVELDAGSMREYFERGEVARATGETYALEDVRLRAPINPRKFFHTAGNFREHEEDSKQVNWSHAIAPWIVFFQNIDAIVGPDDPVVYPEHLTKELDYELELAVVIRKPGKWFSPEEAMDYIGGYLVFNDITARDIQRARCSRGCSASARPSTRSARSGRGS